MVSDTTFLDLTVGPYHLALRTTCVLVVLQDVAVEAPLTFRGQRLGCCDLQQALLGRPRVRLPFVIVFETGKTWSAIGVDAVGHLRHTEAQVLSSLQLPQFGLREPQLFEGALRLGQRLLLALHAQALGELATRAA